MKLVPCLGVFLIACGVIGYIYTYAVDHRSAASLSAYCTMGFQGSRDQYGRVEGATLTLVDYRYNRANPKAQITLIVDGAEWEIDAVTKQLPPTYSLENYPADDAFRNTNRFFIEVPFGLLSEIIVANELRVKFAYDDGTVIDLPLNEDDLAAWKAQLK